MASKRNRVKSPALPVEAPADAAAAALMVSRIGELTRDFALAQAAMEEQIAAIKLAAQQAVIPLAAEMKKLHAGVQAWAEAHRAELTRDGRTKTVKLTTGELQWRHLPPRVKITDEAAVIAFLQKTELRRRFLRDKIEINRDAMKAEPDAARMVPGVSIGSGGEEFIVIPAGGETQLAEQAAE